MVAYQYVRYSVTQTELSVQALAHCDFALTFLDVGNGASSWCPPAVAQDDVVPS